MYNEKLKKTKYRELPDKKKISKRMEENKMTVSIKRLLSKFNLYWNFMCL